MASQFDPAELGEASVEEMVDLTDPAKEAPDAKKRPQRRGTAHADDALLGARAQAIKESAEELARDEVMEAVNRALERFHGSLADFEKLSGLDKSHVSRIANGKMNAGPVTLARIALALGKSLHISIE